VLRDPGFGLKPKAWPWPVTSRLAELHALRKERREPGHPSCGLSEAAKAGSAARLKLCSGATSGAVSGVRSIRQLCSTIVLIAEVDKRRAVLATPGQ
jgi:hypothetical protein